MTNYLPWLIASLLVMVALTLTFMRWYYWQRLSNLRAAGEHYQCLGELIGKIEGSSESSDESKKLASWLASWVFDQNKMKKIYNEAKKTSTRDERKIVERLKETARELEITTPEMLWLVARANFETNIVIMLTCRFPLIGWVLVSDSGLLLKELEKRMEKAVGAATDEIDWPSGMLHLVPKADGETVGSNCHSGTEEPREWPKQRLGNHISITPLIPFGLNGNHAAVA